MADPCLLMWGECPQSPDSHMCGRSKEHNVRCRCVWCGATCTVIDAIFEDQLELEEALEALDG